MYGKVGETNPNYSGGRPVNAQGYINILVPGHGRSEYVLEHRHIMEKKLGRKLRRDEAVHHKNGVKTDNRLCNLELMSNSAHSRYHALRGDTGIRLIVKRAQNG